jgi:heterodisulfide reductase subunit B
MDDLFTALGAECVYFPDRVRCCGGMLATTAPALGEELTANVLDCAARNGADVVLTTCPLCQINLEAHEARGDGRDPIPVFFFTQVLGIALGASATEMDLHRSLVPLGGRLRAALGA